MRDAAVCFVPCVVGRAHTELGALTVVWLKLVTKYPEMDKAEATPSGSFGRICHWLESLADLTKEYQSH